MTTNLVLLTAYSAVLILMGLWIGRRVSRAGDFFVARRGLGPGLVFATVLAANIGAGSTVGATGLGYQHGLSAWWWNGSAAIGSLLLAVWVGPRIWREASRCGFYTAGDFLEHHFGRSVRGAVAGLIWLGTLSILAGQMIGLAWILNVVAGIPKWAGCLAGGAVVVTYFTAGGLLGSAWVNLVQLVVLLAGFAVALPVLLLTGGGWPDFDTGGNPPAGFLSFWGGTQSAYLLALLVPAFIVSPGLIQKAFGGESERAVRTGVAANGAILLVFAFVPALLGMLARARHPGLPQPELALPTILASDLPSWIGALTLAAIFSAEISTSDAILFMLATSLSRDLYGRFVNPGADDRQLLRIARRAAVAGGALGVALAMFLPSVIAALAVFYSILGVSLFVPVVAGLHARGLRARDALAAIAGGAVVFLAVHLATGGRGYGFVSANLAGTAGAAVSFALSRTVGGESHRTEA
ncbi:MAG: sodium:solute symporter [Vicinamibacterales bacterium]